jgi:hypothetical protein
MRISGGAARGAVLAVPKGDAVRPATDGMRQAVFSALGARLAGARFADLFAGSGGYGLEAWSRGAAGGVYNLATGRETTILELATLINEYTGNRTPVDLRPARDWDRSGKRFASTEKAARELGFTARTDIHEGLRQTVQWTKDNSELISRSIARHEKLMAQAVKTGG